MDLTRLDVGPLNKRIEGMITTGLDDVVQEVQCDLAAGAPLKGFRTKAIRHLMILGAKAYARDKARRA